MSDAERPDLTKREPTAGDPDLAPSTDPDPDPDVEAALRDAAATYHQPTYHQPSYARSSAWGPEPGQPVQRPWGTGSFEAVRPEPAASPAGTATSPGAYAGDSGMPALTSPYAAPSPYGPAYPASVRPDQRPFDGVSITGFVLSLTCCLSFVGAVLGAIGIARTSKQRRSGRWAAVSALVVGSIGTVVTIVVVVGATMVLSSTRLVEEMAEGECADRAFGDESSWPWLREVSCDDDHDGEVAFAGERDDVDAALEALGVAPERARRDDVERACLDLAADAGTATQALRGGIDSGAIELNLLADVESPRGHHAVVCFAEPSRSAEKLDTRLLG